VIADADLLQCLTSDEPMNEVARVASGREVAWLGFE
jgi:hypothetical protein